MTIKEYYKDEFLTNCRGKALEITKEGVILDRTVAFPEGGGQEGDRGVLKNIKTGEEFKFYDTTKEGGRRLALPDFYSISVDTNVVHHMNEEELKKIKIGEEFEVFIDVERRAKLTMYHTGIHIVLMALEKLRPNITDLIFGAKISDTYARLDFKVIERFTQEEIEQVTNITNELIKENKDIKTYHHEKEEEALYWTCGDLTIPCGGTHLTKTGYLGDPLIKRKNLGKMSERIILTFNEYKVPLSLYHS